MNATIQTVTETIDILERTIRTCHAIMKSREEVNDMAGAKHWARKGLENKPLLLDAQLKLFILKQDKTHTFTNILQEI